MKKSIQFLAIGSFFAFLLFFTVLRLVLPDRSFSENENRYLDSKPEFSFSSLFSGKYTEAFEAYMTDQFPFRDSWISLKSRTERALGKTENNGVFFGSDDTLLTRLEPVSESSINAGIEAVNALASQTEAEVCLALIPGSTEIWKDRLPANAVSADQKALIDRIYDGCDVLKADVYAALEAHKEEAIFYRTDHHWTTLGAYYGYCATAEALGLSPAPLSSFTPETVSEDFYGTVFSSSGVRWVEPDSIQIFVPDSNFRIRRYESSEGELIPLYDRSKLDTKDQYAMFFGGNTPRLVIENGLGSGKLLVLRDSYSDCEIPFLLAHYGEIHVLDLRYYRQSVQRYVEEHGIETVLVNYSLSNFVSDLSIYQIGS